MLPQRVPEPETPASQQGLFVSQRRPMTPCSSLPAPSNPQNHPQIASTTPAPPYQQFPSTTPAPPYRQTPPTTPVRNEQQASNAQYHHGIHSMKAHLRQLEHQNNTHFAALESRITAQMQQVATQVQALVPLPSQMRTLRQDVLVDSVKAQEGKSDIAGLKEKVGHILDSLAQVQQAVGATQGQMGALQEQMRELRHDIAYTRWHGQEVEQGVVGRLEAVQVRMDAA
jgi:hypothetical protein